MRLMFCIFVLIFMKALRGPVRFYSVYQKVSKITTLRVLDLVSLISLNKIGFLIEFFMHQMYAINIYFVMLRLAMVLLLNVRRTSTKFTKVNTASAGSC